MAVVLDLPAVDAEEVLGLAVIRMRYRCASPFLAGQGHPPRRRITEEIIGARISGSDQHIVNPASLQLGGRSHPETGADGVSEQRGMIGNRGPLAIRSHAFQSDLGVHHVPTGFDDHRTGGLRPAEIHFHIHARRRLVASFASA